MGVCPLRSEYEFETSPHVSCTWEPSTSGTQSPYDVVNAWWPPYAERWNGVSKVFIDGLKEPDAGFYCLPSIKEYLNLFRVRVLGLGA